MSYRFDFDAKNRIIRIRFEGGVTDEELRSYYKEAARLVKKTGAAAGITDFSAVTEFEVSRETVLDLARTNPALPEPQAPRIVIAPSPVIFGLARMFEMIGERTRPNMHVVKTEEEAWAILGVWEPKFKAIDTEE